MFTGHVFYFQIKCHMSYNVMTLEAGVYLLFDDLKLFFEAVGWNRIKGLMLLPAGAVPH